MWRRHPETWHRGNNPVLFPKCYYLIPTLITGGGKKASIFGMPGHLSPLLTSHNQYQNGSSNLLTPYYREQPRSTRIAVAYPRPVFSATNWTNYAPTNWLPTRKKLLYTVANPARGLLNREKKKKSLAAAPPPRAVTIRYSNQSRCVLIFL